MLTRRQLLSDFQTEGRVPFVSDLAPLSDNEPCDDPETTTENCTSDTETVQSETGQNGHAGHDATESYQDMPVMTLPSQIRTCRS